MITADKALKWADIGYWILIIGNALYNLGGSFVEEFIREDGSELQMIAETYGQGVVWFGIFLSGIPIFLFFVLFAMLKFFYLTIMYFGIKKAKKSFYNDKLNKTDKKSEEYYREILPNLSPGVLSYIDDFKINENDVVATIMMLELRGKIKIDEKIEILNYEEEGLTHNEKYIFQCLKKGEANNINLMYFESAVVKDVIDNKLLQENKDIKKNVIKKVIVNVIVYLTIMIIGFNYQSILGRLMSVDNNIVQGIANILSWISGFVVFGVFATSFLYIPICISYISKYYIMNKLNPYIRNKKAVEINKKLEGLKAYLKDFTNINDRNKEEMTLWKEYMIYSVMFEQNPKITNEILEIMKK